MTKFLAETQNECIQIDNLQQQQQQELTNEDKIQEKLIAINQLKQEIHNKVNKLTENNCDNLLVLNNNNNNNNNNISNNNLNSTNTNNNNTLNDNDKSSVLFISDDSVNQSIVKPILLSGDGNAGNSLQRKKSVTFDTIDTSLNKFIDGDVIVDKKNPFKTLLIYENGNNVLNTIDNKNKNVNKKFFKVPVTPNQELVIDDEPFITKDEILNQSKYVKTYIKNPDRILTYDHSIIERLNSEEEQKSFIKPKLLPKPTPSPRTKLQALKYKYNPSNLYSLDRKKKSVKIDEIDSKIPKKNSAKNQNGIKYPELSDLKIKTGTVIDKTFYNPKEVALNVQKFDTRFKEVNLGSQDDLDEIAELTSLEPDDYTTNEETITTDEADSSVEKNTQVSQQQIQPQHKEEEKKSLTNTVNSREFQEFLKKKGLSLIPEYAKTKESNLKNNESIDNSNGYYFNDKMDTKTIKKRSVLQRLFQGGIFSSKNRTNPKELNSPPPNVYTRSKDDIKNPEMKRVILERSSFNSNTTRPSITSNDHLKKQYSVRDKPIKQASISDGRSSSISSALTAADDYVDMNMASISGGSDSRLEMEITKPIRKSERLVKNNSVIEQSPKSTLGVRRVNSSSEYPIYRTIDPNRVRTHSKLKPPSGRNSAPITSLAEMMEQARMTNGSVTHDRRREIVPLTFENNSVQVGDGVIKPRVQRPNLPITTQRSLPGTLVQDNSGRIMSPSRSRHTLERQYNRPTGENYWLLNRSSSVDRRDNKPQIIYRKQEPIQKIQGVSAEVKISSPFVYGVNNSKKSDYVTPKTSREHLLDGPKNSTPLNTNLRQDEIHQTSISTVSSGQSPVKKTELDPHAWAKLQQLKQNMDKELYGVKLITPESVYGRTDNRIHNRRGSLQIENIYESTEKLRAVNQQQYNNMIIEPHIRPVQFKDQVDASFVRASPQRNTIGSIYRNRMANGNNVDPLMNNTNIRTLMTPVPRQIDTQPQNRFRSQSVLDNMTSEKDYQNYRRLANPTPVIMRRPDQSLNKLDIRNQVLEFCRRSMSRTPTKLQTSNRDLLVAENNTNEKISVDISPVSYVSVNSAKPSLETVNLRQKHAPEVPKRVQSLQKSQQNSPIYAPVMKRSSLISNSSDVFDIKKPIRTSKVSTDSVFLNDEVDRPINISLAQLPTYPNNDQSLYEQRNVIYTPSSRNEHYGHIQGKTIQSNYGNLPKRNTVEQDDSIIYNVPRTVPNLPQGNEIYVSRVPNLRLPDGRTTPLTLYSHDARGPTVVLKNIEQMYRPIIPNQRSGIPQRQQSKYTQQQQQQLQIQQQLQLQQQHQFQQQMQLQQQQRREQQVQQQQHKQQKQILQQQYQGYGSTRKMQTYLIPYESESGSEAGEVQRIMQNRKYEEDWQNEKGGRNQQTDQATEDRRRGGRREDPRRHTLGSDMLHYGGQGQPQRAMDLETPPVRGYTPINQGPLFDDDPGIMSEVETASTGFRRGGKQRSSLPVVRTPSKTLERPLGLVFLQYRSETKRALLPNEITSIDTVRALFVRSFPRQLTMAYLEGPNVKIYIHDASKDMFYELEDVRSHLREIRDRSVLRLFESNEVVAPQVLPQVLPGGPGVPKPLPPSGGGHWDQDQSYFSEPEFDSEYQHQHIHKSKGGKGANPYYVGGAQTLPRGMYTDRNKNAVGAPAKPLRSSYGSSMFPYPPDQLYSIPDGYMSSPERGTRGSYEEPYYSQYGTRGGAVTPIIDEEQRHIFTNYSESSLADDQYSLYGVKVSGRIPRGANQMYDPTRPEDLHRIRVEHMERQLANLTGLVQKALIQNPTIQPSVNPNYLGVPGRGVPDDNDGHSSSSSTSIQANGTGDDLYIREKPPKLGKSSCHKSVSFEKSVSFSDDIQGVQKSHNPQHPADTKPPKPAIKSSTLPRTSSQERDRLKPPPPPKPLGLAPTHQNYRTTDLALAPEVYNHLRGLQKKAKDLRTEVRTLRRLSQAQAVAVREDIKDAFMRIRATLLASSGSYWGQGDEENMTRLSREEELYKQEAVRLEKDLGDLENSVESLRTEVINRRTRVNMSAVEDMALVLSRASKTVAELKMRYPGLESGLRNIMNNEMEKIIQEEKFMKDEPMRLESALRRCKKLTGTLVTLKRLASVQEQRLPCAEPTQNEENPPRSAEVQSTNKPIPSPRLGTVSGGLAPENALDALLDELQTFAKPPGNSESRPDDSTSDDSSQTLQNTVTIQLSQSSLYPSESGAPNIGLRRLHSYPSGSDTDTSPPQPQRPSGKPPVPERNADLLSKVSNKRIPPPPPPRTSSRSPLASPTSPNLPIRLAAVTETLTEQNLTGGQLDGNNSSSSESVNSQDQVQRQLALELRHQELLKKQKQLQEQYARLQQMSKNTVALQPNDIMQLKKTGSESNLPQKMGLSMSVSGSMKNLNSENNLSIEAHKNDINSNQSDTTTSATGTTTTSTTNKVYETDIL